MNKANKCISVDKDFKLQMVIIHSLYITKSIIITSNVVLQLHSIFMQNRIIIINIETRTYEATCALSVQNRRFR